MNGPGAGGVDRRNSADFRALGDDSQQLHGVPELCSVPLPHSCLTTTLRWHFTPSQEGHLRLWGMQSLPNENDQPPFLSSSGQTEIHILSGTKQLSRHFLRPVLEAQVPGDSGAGCDLHSATALSHQRCQS